MVDAQEDGLEPHVTERQVSSCANLSGIKQEEQVPLKERNPKDEGSVGYMKSVLAVQC